MNNCKCHSVPFVNEYDSICRVNWAEYEALLFFMEKGLNKKEAEQCVKDLHVDDGISKLRDELNTILEATIRQFQLKCRETLSKEKGESIYRQFLYLHKGGKQKRKVKYDKIDSKRKVSLKHRPICKEPNCKFKAKKRYYKGVHNSFDLYCEKRKGHNTTQKKKKGRLAITISSQKKKKGRFL